MSYHITSNTGKHVIFFGTIGSVCYKTNKRVKRGGGRWEWMEWKSNYFESPDDGLKKFNGSGGHCASAHYTICNLVVNKGRRDRSENPYTGWSGRILNADCHE